MRAVFGRKGRDTRDRRGARERTGGAPSPLSGSREGGVSCCQRIGKEFFMNPFQVEDATGKSIDLMATFSPRPTWVSTFLKFILFASALATMITGIVMSDPAWFYFATFKHWAFIVTTLYFLMSLVHTMDRPEIASNRYIPFLTRVTWTLYVIAAPSQLLSCILYWALEFDDINDLEFDVVMVNGVFAVLLFWEGWTLNSVPIRLNHIWWFAFFIVCFFGWTLIHAKFEIGNPTNPYGDDLYFFLPWDDEPDQAAIVFGFTMVVVVPICFHTIWLFSLATSRRFQKQKDVRERLVEASESEDESTVF